MPLKDPGSYRDKTADWLEFFVRARHRELSGLITPDLIREHREDPRGISSRHSAALQDVLNYLHGQPIEGKSFIYAAVPYQKYYLGSLHARGTAPTIMADREFTDERAAVHALFLKRLASLGLERGADAGDGQ